MPYNRLVSLYISQGFGPKAARIWTPGDPGTPNRAGSKQELLSFCLQPDPLPCPSAECGNMRYIAAQPCPRRRYWFWSQRKHCSRCKSLRGDHGLELTELIAMWEAQDRRCYYCRGKLGDPRANRHGSAAIDHDHRICPQGKHSCERCRRGLACNECNVQELSLRSTGTWVLPQGGDLTRWLEFLSPADRDRLRLALTLFPEQPVRRPHPQQSQEATVIPLFDSDACA